MTTENLRYKLGVVEKAKFEHCPLDKAFNKELDEKEKKEGLLERFKNIENKNEEQLHENEYQGKKQLDIINKQVKKKTIRSN